MRILTDIDDELVATARELTGLQQVSDVLRAALKALIANESARRLALLGGMEPDLELPVRRRFDSKPGDDDEAGNVGARLISHLRGRGDGTLTTDEIMALTRGDY